VRLRNLWGLYVALAYPEIIDISHWNTVDDLAAIKQANIVGIIFKASEGTWMTDPVFLKLWRPALDLGFVVMVYHFFRSSVGGRNQAQHHLEVTRELYEAAQGQIISWYDVETVDGTTVTTRRERLLACLREHGDMRNTPGVYSSPSLWGELVGNVPWMADYWGWNAHWTTGTPTLPVGWLPTRTKVWQYGIYPKHSWTPYTPGIEGEVDHNYFLGTEAGLRQWVGLDVLPTLEQRVESLERRVTVLESSVS
jgi:GH25 family lysozyme M1 (1,4-beta-N-acetylmuramidase)